MRLDRVMADRKISATELAQRIDSTPVNISRIKNGHIRGIRFSTLEQLCIELKCAPGDLIEPGLRNGGDPRQRRGLRHPDHRPGAGAAGHDRAGAAHHRPHRRHPAGLRGGNACAVDREPAAGGAAGGGPGALPGAPDERVRPITPPPATC